MWHRFVLPLVLSAACGSPSPSVPDAPHHADAARVDAALDAFVPDAYDGPDLSCVGQPSPSTAPDTLPLDGKVFVVDHYQVMPFAGATLTVHRRSDDAVLATSSTTAADGTYALSAHTNGTALDAYLTVAAPGEVPVQIDPGDPLTTGFFGLALVAPADEIQRWYADAGTTYSPDAATLIAIAVDCNHASITGATMTLAPQASLVYYNNNRWDPAATASDKGYALVHPSAPETITAAWHTTQLPPHAVTAPASTLTLAVLSPYKRPTDP
ncbi:MAG TPA: hypothetical protein VJ696_05660 [Rhodanobacteraceae bacterium]|nr:hypothetical protein [Rhodanobacteraceae bacterium]